ncbi:hypothetical protein SSCG_04937 [Streptomyces clavuligerus]|nr:hypothetical protein SSCG_04937 [Streptomyces clavuligerus]
MGDTPKRMTSQPARAAERAAFFVDSGVLICFCYFYFLYN